LVWEAVCEQEFARADFGFRALFGLTVTLRNRDEESTRQVVASLGDDPEFESRKRELIVRLKLDPTDPVGSGAVKVADLLCALQQTRNAATAG